jgi:hypothetical protein
MTEPTLAQPPVPGLLARAFGIVTSPKATFEAALRLPRPAGILFLTSLLVALAAGLPQFTERGRQAALDMQVQQVERFTGQKITDEAYSAMERRSQWGGYLVIGSVFIVTPIVCLLLTALYWALFNAVLGGAASFKQVLTVVTHSTVIGALGAVLGAPVQYYQGTVTTAGPFNLGALVPMLDETSFLAHFLSSINVFSIWGVIVTAIGLGVLYQRKSRSIAVALLGIYVVIVGCIAYFFHG